MTWGSFWNGFKKVVSAPFKLVANVGKTVYNKAIKPIANVGVNAIKSVGNFVKDTANTVIHMPEKVLHTIDHAVDKGGDTLQALYNYILINFFMFFYMLWVTRSN